MHFDLEKKFVNDFINPSFRDRFLFELKSSKKRLDAVMRFSHNTAVSYTHLTLPTIA